MLNILYKPLLRRVRFLKIRLLRKVRPILWPNDIRCFPFKMRRFPEFAEQFMAEKRLREESNPRKQLSVDSYRQLIVDNKSEEVVKQVVSYYNRVLFRSRFCPTTVTIEQMKYIIENTSEPHRQRRQLDFLFIKEFDIWRNNILQENYRQIRRAEEERQLSEFKFSKSNDPIIGCFDDNNNIQYGFWRNTLFTRNFEKAVKRYTTHNLRTATLFGQKLVIDCSFDEEMQEYEIQSVGRQMTRIYFTNRMESREPFDLHFCNCNPNSRVMKTFMKYINPIKDLDKYYINIHSETYSQLFPNEKLIYLSPDAKYTMEEFDPKAIYILGSLVGKTCKLPLTRDKAISEGIECLRLPIHKYVELNPLVKKTLSFQGVFKILLDMKDHNDWQRAFKRGIEEHKLKRQ